MAAAIAVDVKLVWTASQPVEDYMGDIYPSRRSPLTDIRWTLNGREAAAEQTKATKAVNLEYR